MKIRGSCNCKEKVKLLPLISTIAKPTVTKKLSEIVKLTYAMAQFKNVRRYNSIRI